MQTILKIMSEVMDFIAKNTLRIAFTIILLVGLIIKPMYCFDDSPYFELIKWYDIIIQFIMILFVYLIYKGRDYIQKHFRYFHGFLLFVSISCIYIYMVPLKPFSDMQYIYEAAINFSTFCWDDILLADYWQAFSGNIYLGVFWGVLIFFFPKKLVTFKLINMLFAFGTIYYTSKMCKEYGYKYDKVTYLMLIFFVPLVLYENHIYFDLPFVFLCIFGIYIWKKYQNIYIVACIIGLARYVRTSGTIVMLAIMFAAIFKDIPNKMNIKEVVKHILKIISVIFIFVLVFKGCAYLVDRKFDSSELKRYPMWNQIYIGLNETEFGFMDNDFSYDRNVHDVIDRVSEYGPIKMTKIFAKKIEWTWMQGTYQAERYAFGNNTEIDTDKFEYSTILTKFLLNDSQKARILINSIMRSQYVILFMLMIVGLWKNKDISDKREIYYIMIATFLILIIYEMKSRYVFHCLPIMAILGCGALEIDIKKITIKN